MVEGIPKHFPFPASGAERWFNCQLSITKGNTLPDKPSTIYALTGTAIHSLGEHCIKKKKNPKKFIGKKVKVIDEADNNKLHKIEITEELAAACHTYVTYCLKKLKADVYAYGVEKRGVVKGTDDKVGGTADFFYHQGSTLEIVDYKNGQWKVSPKGNKQLAIYALSVIDSSQYFDKYTDKVKLTIVQPLSGEKKPIKTWETDRKWLETIRKNCIAAVKRQKLFPDNALTGPHCKWCKVGDAALCSARQKEIDAMTINDFSDSVDDLYVVSVLESKKRILDYIEACEAYAHRRMIEEGKEIKGLKVIKGSGKRVYRNSKIAIAEYLTDRGYDLVDIYEEPELLPLTKLEKIIDKKHLDKIIKVSEGKEKIVLDNSAQDDFEEDW